ncbi:2-hydroxychromene-2-carboxylate isomerase [Pelagivirga sediminicola]|uniref:2-hydroxychromene-2-carboxylate isomerase n=1 Tax=Pelagivirga sediminicola TaxID=2170575 RepID=A0A2T7G660_9RHOB|nr:2-hydroxychromene-2-carboxylate isomerase [Pelagivirga sediminicola]PVA09900.1 2-hydroxychromene-2-carboxylate isomerase [Pelagivirga sediminicola]
MASIDYFFSVLSPYAYLAGDRLECIAEAHGAHITYKPIDFMALIGRMGARGPAHPARGAYMAQDIARLAARLDMTLNAHPAHWPTNPAPAAYAIVAAQEAGGGDVGALVRGLMRACWAEERDVARAEVLRDCLQDAGFDPALEETGLLQGAVTYAANLEEALERGVIGIPFYLAPGGAAFWGQDRLDDLDRHLAGGA